MSHSVKTSCPYCGVGCGVIATTGDDGEISIKGDSEHPANFGRLCSKGSALAETLDLDGRLLHPEVNGERSSWDRALNAVADGFKNIMDEHGPDAVAFYVSGQLLTEDYYVANKLMKGFIGSANIDTNSRLCMSSAVSAYKRAFGSDTVPCSYDDLDRAKLIVITGSNIAWCHPVIYQRIVRVKKNNPDLRVVVIDPRRTASCDIADLHLPLRPGHDATLFNGLLSYLAEVDEGNELFTSQYTEGADEALAEAQRTAPTLDSVAAQCQLDSTLVEQFYKLYARTERVVTLFSQGINQSTSGTDKGNAIINCHLYSGRIGRPGMGPFSLTGQPNAMGGREVGGLANQLTAHMDLENSEHRALVQEFWQSPVIAEHQGLKAVELFSAIDSGQVKAVWIMATNPLVSLPDANRVKSALQKCELVVVSDVVSRNDTLNLAHIKLPALAWGEKSGTVTNTERRISRQRPFLSPPGEAKADWWIVSEVAKRIYPQSPFNYLSVSEIFCEYAQLTGYKNSGSRDLDISGLADLNAEQYTVLNPVQWPVTVDRPHGTNRMFSDGRFYTASGRAQLIPVTPREPDIQLNEQYPFILNSGRIRDQWHTM
ncbi:MAG: molybdopterin-dependent oxidoreductase, partial [Gammaproteobacteria bacterium]|nr:molybdopterin-dependent oxidoreductase [Gammaproteobacteria bacterium]